MRYINLRFTYLLPYLLRISAPNAAYTAVCAVLTHSLLLQSKVKRLKKR